MRPSAEGDERPRSSRPTASGNGHGNGNGNGHASATRRRWRRVVREVEVTRRLYRSGESEYLIDGQQCRLKDIHELLMDTGLGAKAYSIIEQGKIGMILSSRPTDRRQLIEEAAGITKYKARRRAAELKLEAAQQNLTRLDDIVFEVEKQRGSLKRQAAKARRYTRLRDEMRRWEKVLFARRYRALAEAIESARGAADRRARATRRRPRPGWPKSRPSWHACASSWPRPSARRPQSREAAHARELDINRRAAANRARSRSRPAMLRARAASWSRDASTWNPGASPSASALEGRRRRSPRPRTGARRGRRHRRRPRPRTTRTPSGPSRRVEQDVERARARVYAVINTVTALTCRA